MLDFIVCFQVEATGNEQVANDSINYVRRGGTLMIYGVYSDSARVHWPPSKIFGDEIKVRDKVFTGHAWLTTRVDHRLFCPDSLFPSSCGIS